MLSCQALLGGVYACLLSEFQTTCLHTVCTQLQNFNTSTLYNDHSSHRLLYFYQPSCHCLNAILLVRTICYQGLSLETLKVIETILGVFQGIQLTTFAAYITTHCCVTWVKRGTERLTIVCLTHWNTIQGIQARTPTRTVRSRVQR